MRAADPAQEGCKAQIQAGLASLHWGKGEPAGMDRRGNSSGLLCREQSCRTQECSTIQGVDLASEIHT